ncbi:MAG: type II secretion system protein GspG [Verrucomicrobiales bacterium]|nr:type II secretion system protein GspG [Verrucomicrobiales bacterium]
MNPEPRKPRSRLFRTARALLFGVFLLATVLSLVWAFENWRGERQWQALVQAYAAQGDPLDGSRVRPAEIPPDQDAATTPLLRPLTEFTLVKGEPVWRDPAGVARLDALALPILTGEGRDARGLTALSNWQSAFRATNLFPLPASPGTPAADVLSALGRWNAELNELESASRRPYARFVPGHTGESIGVLLPQLSRAKAISTLLRLRCAARLAAGDPAGALSDIEFNERWAHLVASDPLVINQLVAIAIQTIGNGMAWEGLVDHRWNEDQLSQLQTLFAKRTPREDLLRALKGERAYALSLWDQAVRNPNASTGEPAAAGTGVPIPKGLPRGWIRQNQISFVRLHELLSSPPFPWIVDSKTPRRTEPELRQQLATDRPWAYRKLAEMLIPALYQTMAKADRLLVASRISEIACALERYRLQHQQYPETLEALSPTFLATVPTDPCTAKAFQYRRASADGFVLYSLGPNGRDDGGTFNTDESKADWAWPQPSPEKKRLF